MPGGRHEASGAMGPMARRGRAVPHPKGRQVDPWALREVRSLLGDRPHRRDLLIEHLHLIQDHYHALTAAHLIALAEEMRLAPAEVYEVASFYAHFDLVAEGEPSPPPLTVRVCDSVSCFLNGADRLFEALDGGLRPGVRLTRARCMGRCDRAPVVVVGEHHVDHATAESVAAAVAGGRTGPTLPGSTTDFEDYSRGGGYRLLRDCL